MGVSYRTGPTTVFGFDVMKRPISWASTRLVIDCLYDKSAVARRKRPAPRDLFLNLTEYAHVKQWVSDGYLSVPRTVSGYGSDGKFYPPWTYWYQDTLYGTVGLGRPTLPLLLSDSPNRLLSKIKEEKVNLALMLLEYRETARMFEQLANNVHTMYRGIKSGRLKSLLHKGACGTPSTWLLYRYGITPLASDVAGIRDVLESGLDTPLRRTYRISKHGTDVSSRKLFFSGKTVGSVHTFRDTHLRHFANVEYTSANLKGLTQLGLTNPALLAWEVIPYSFVIDWFVNIGDYLSSLDALTGVSRIAAQKITKSVVVEHWPGGVKGRLQQYNRTNITLSPSPPNWDPSLTWKRLVDSVALLNNLRR